MFEIDAYVCDKCGKYAIGEQGRATIRAHEIIPESGRLDSLDGLVITFESGKIVRAFRQVPNLSQQHEALYKWDDYLGKRLAPKVLVWGEGLTAKHVLNHVLYHQLQEDEDYFPMFKELPKAEFERVVLTLQRRNLPFYGNVKLKRKAPERAII